MRRFGALLLLAALLGARGEAAAADRDDDDDDEDSDPVPFMVVLEHEDRRQCAASLVSLRVGVTTARCARARGPRRELWALAAALVGAVGGGVAPAAGARRVARVALAGDGRDDADPALDMAVLELEEPFGRDAGAQPILMETDARADDASHCHAVRALPAPGARDAPRVRFRVRSVRLVGEARCAGRVPHWAAARARLLCLAGDEMCERDLGGGVVCGGKLRGVLSALGAAGAACGDTLAAQSVARWRRFLQCAHTLRQCGRGECASLCTEQRLLPPAEDAARAGPALPGPDADRATGEPAAARSPRPAAPPAPLTTLPPLTPLTPLTPRRTAPPAADEHAPASRPAAEFEPNRADFKAAQTRTPRVRLKAGEYGDNAADYAAEEPPPPTPTPMPTPTPTHAAAHRSPPVPKPPVPEPPAPALQLAASEPAHAASGSRARRLNAAAPLILYCTTLTLRK